jgi:uncharacterized membrane protein
MLTSAGRVLFGLAMMGFGLEQAVLGTLRDGMPTPPFWLPHSLALGYISAAVLLLGGVALVAGWRVRGVALVVGLFLVGSALLHLAHWHAVVFRGGERTALFEPLALGGAALMLVAQRGVVRVGGVLFGLAMIVFGVQHFMYADIAGLVPRWIPWHHFWVVFTGVVMIACGLAVLVRVGTAFAAIALAAMFFGWLVLLHIPLCVAAPKSGELWASALVVLGLCGASLLVAGGGAGGRRSR